MGRCRNLLWVDSQLNQTDLGTNIISRLIHIGDIEPYLEYYLEKYFNISYSTHAHFYLDSLIVTASWVFSTRVYPRPYPRSPKLPQPESRSEHTDFTTLLICDIEHNCFKFLSLWLCQSKFPLLSLYLRDRS